MRSGVAGALVRYGTRLTESSAHPSCELQRASPCSISTRVEKRSVVCTIAVSVSDGYGAISQRDVIDHVRRARDDPGRPNPATTDEPGAGLGLYLVLANVASLIVNVDPGRLTEVVCLFDLAKRDRRAIAAGVRSLHVFEAP